MLARRGVSVEAAAGLGLLLFLVSPLGAQSSGAAAAWDAAGPDSAVAGGLALAAPFTADTAQEAGAGIEPAIAGGMSAFLVPGAGQFYNGQNAKGALMLSGVVASLVVAFTAGIGEKEVCAPQDMMEACATHPAWPNSRFWLGLGSAAGIHTWSILDAVAVARGTRRDGGSQRDARLELAPQHRNGQLGLAAGIRLTR
jgi:hypothetical protein